MLTDYTLNSNKTHRDVISEINLLRGIRESLKIARIA